VHLPARLILNVEGSENGASLFVGPLRGRTRKDVLSKALEMGVCFCRVSVLGNMGGGAHFLGSLREGKICFSRRTFIEEFERHVQEGGGNGQPLNFY
jgi:hypothetical protein